MNEKGSLFLNDFQGNKSNSDYILGILEGNDKIDLIEIEARELLNKIKQMININLLPEEANEIDGDFINSLKKLIVITNNNVTKEYLKKLSYIYYAIYNDTLDVYYEISREINELEYYMLDKNFYNNIMYTEPIDWKKYNQRCNCNMLRYAYSNNCIAEVLKILKINPDWDVNTNSDLIKKVTKENLINLFNEYGVELVANSDFDHLNNYQEENKEYIKVLLLINPKLQIEGPSLFSPNVRQVFEQDEIAFFDSYQQQDIDYLDTSLPALKWYKEALEEKSDFSFGSRFVEQELVKWMIDLKTEIPVQIYMKLDGLDISRLWELHRACMHPDSKIGLKEKMKLNSYVKDLIKKYKDQKVLIKKV